MKFQFRKKNPKRHGLYKNHQEQFKNGFIKQVSQKKPELFQQSPSPKQLHLLNPNKEACLRLYKQKLDGKILTSRPSKDIYDNTIKIGQTSPCKIQHFPCLFANITSLIIYRNSTLISCCYMHMHKALEIIEVVLDSMEPPKK